MKKFALLLLLAGLVSIAKTVPVTIADISLVSTGTTRLTTATTKAYSLLLQAPSTNSGKIYVGDSSVSSTQGIELAAGQSITMSPIKNGGRIESVPLNSVYFIAATTGDKVKILYQQVLP